jgi:hypothetical protein
MRKAWFVWPLLGVYYLLLAVGWLVPAAKPSIEAALPPLAAMIVALGLAATAWTAYRRDGLERQVLLEATCIAFFVTVLAGAFVDAPWTYDIGIAVWFGITVLRTRQLVR